MNIGRFIITAVISIGYLITSMAQQVWPIKVTGALVPPHSLNLGVYGAERTQDLTFNAILIDPVQASLQVRLSLSIEQNGNVIYQTDPNYLGMPITLSQFQNVLIDGNALRSYLTPQALTGARGVGTGSLEIPEGFNQICMQLYGVEKNVPLSNKFCMSGNFRLNQPPIFVKPACGEKIKMAPTQNMIFNWSPMHLGSSNSPGAVEYEYELVQLPQGTFNANDAFDSGLKVYKTKSFTPTIIYTQAEPRLVPNVVYAWRVRASSMLHPTSKLFQNDGLSQICTFMLYDGDMPDDNINPTNNPSPMGCAVYSTEYGTIDKSEQISQSLIDGDVVKVGYFNMKIQSVSGGTDGYSGKGLIEYPMLKSMIPVTFSGIKINSERRVYASDRIEAAVSPSCALTDAQLKESQIGNYINNNYFTSKLLPEMDRSNNYVVRLDVNSPKVNTLPIAMGAGGAVPTIYVIGMQFTPANAFLNLAGLQTDAADNISGIYAATAIQATPYGLKNGSYLVPVGQSSGNGNAVSIIPSIDLIQSSDGGSRITCDCNGYLEAKLKNALQISPDIIVRSDNGGPVVLDLKETKADKETYFGESKKMPEFEFKGLEKFKLSANRVFVDLSNTAVIENSAKYNTADKNIVAPNWRGVIIQDASVTLPESFNILNNKTALVLDQGEILINENSIPYARFSKDNLIGIEQGKVENWKYSVDKYTLNIENNTVVGPSISGQIKLPISEDPMSYTGELLQSGNGNARMNIAMPTENLKIDMWSANMSLFKESYIGLEIKNLGNEKMMYPSAKLSGDLNIKVSNTLLADKIKGNVAQTLADIKQALGVQTDDLSFSVSKLNINNWNLSPYDVPENKYTANSVDVDKARFEMGGKSFKVTHGEVVKRTIDNKEQIGMSVVIKEGNNKINFILWAGEDNGVLKLDQIEAKIIDIRCNCTVEPSAIGKVELQKLYDKLIDEAYADIAQSAGPSSGKQSSELYNNTEFQLFHAKMKSELEVNTTAGGWIVKDGKVTIPFLGIEIKVTQTGNKLVGVKGELDFYSNNFTVPIFVNPAMFQKLGFHTLYNIPIPSVLLITDLNIPDINQPGGFLTFEIQSELNNGKTLVFESQPVKITNSETNAIKIENLALKLKSDIQVDDYVFKASSSKAKIDCTKGFESFDMVGLYTPKNLVEVDDKKSLNMLFTVNTSLNGNDHDLSDFIGVISDKNNKDEKWKFHVPNEPHLVFTAGEKFSIYLDKSPKKKIPNNYKSKNFEEINNETFQGIVFETFAAELPMFKLDDGKDLTIPLSDGMYFIGDKSLEPVFSIKHASDDLNPNNEKKANFSGWKYSLDGLSFNMVSSKFQEPVNYYGKMLIPIFKEKPKDSDKRKFNKGWINFVGTVSSVSGEISSAIRFTDFGDQLYQPLLMPGMAMKLDSSSNVNVIYNKETKKWIPKGTFTGLCDFYLNKNFVASLNLTSPKVDIQTSAISFANLTVSSENFSSGTTKKLQTLKFKLDDKQIAYIDLGNWGDVDTRDVATNDNLVNLVNRLNAMEAPEPKKPAGFSKAMPSGPAPLDGFQISEQAKFGTHGVPPTTNKQQPANTAGQAGNKAKPAGNNVKLNPALFMGFDLVSTYLGPKVSDTGELIMGLKLAIGLMGAVTQPSSTGATSATGGTSASSATGATAPKTGTTRSQSIKAEGVLNLVYKQEKVGDGYEFNKIRLECLAVDGAIGPVGFAGGLNIIDSDEKFGSGLKGYLSGDIDGLGGMTIVGQFGNKKESENSYYYGFLDLEVFSDKGKNIPKTPIDLHGLGGGIHVNMNIDGNKRDTIIMPSLKEMEEKDKQTKTAENRKIEIDSLKKESERTNEPKGFCENVGPDLLKPGKGLNQSYIPQQGIFGGKVFLIGALSGNKDKFMFDAGIEISIEVIPTTNEFRFNEMKISGRGYFMPESIRERRSKNVGDVYAGFTFNWPDRLIQGDIAFRSKFDLPTVGTIFSMPENYAITDFNTRTNYNTGRIRFGFDTAANANYKPYVELKLGGPGTGKPGTERLQPVSGKFMNTTLLAYAQIGANVDPPRSLTEMLPDLKGLISKNDSLEAEKLKLENKKEVEIGGKPSQGIAFGLVLQQKVNANFVLLHANLDVKVGFDVNLRQYNDVKCGNLEYQDKIGLDGWYAKGSAFAYAKGKIDIGFRLFGVDMTANVMTVAGYLLMQMQGPNPTYFGGKIGGSYNVMAGMYSGAFEYPVVIGEKCVYTKPPDPLADITIFKNASIVDNQTNVDRYSDITLNTNIPLGKDYPLTQLDTKGVPDKTKNFKADYKEGSIVVKKGTQTVISNVRLNATNDKEIIISFDEALEPETKYTVEYQFGWFEKEGTESAPKYVDRNNPEKGTITFTTGKRPTTITPGMIEYSAPGIGQRYWHKGYANTEIKFLKKAGEDAKALFPLKCETCKLHGRPNQDFKFIYYVRLIKFNDADAALPFYDYLFKIIDVPGQGEKFDKLESKSQTIDGKYNITYLEKSSVDVLKVSFPDLKKFELEKGKIYKLSIVREVDFILDTVDVDDPNYSKIGKMLKDHYLVLQSYHFATSNYDNLTEKLKDMTVNHVKSDVKLRDFSHPSDVYDSDRASVISKYGESRFHSVRDDFYSFAIKDKKNGETFDKYDILRLRRNIKLDYSHDYTPELHLDKLHQGLGMNGTFKDLLERKEYNITGANYLKKVLWQYSKAEKDGKLEFGSSNRISDGTQWHYRVTGATDTSLQTLTEKEIKTNKIDILSNTPNLSNGNPQLNKVEGDLLIQDLRSRIVINQMFWLSRIRSGYYDGDAEFEALGTQGEFIKDGRRDFSWITKPPSDRPYTKKESGNFAYIADEPGYRLSYHGKSAISFPKGGFAEMVESKREKKEEYDKALCSFSPNRTRGSEITIANVNELSTEEWYYVIDRARYERYNVVHKSDWKYDIWGLEPPIDVKKDGTFNAANAYMIYTPGQGLIHDNGWNDIENLESDGSNNWNFINNGDGFDIKNSQTKKHGDVRFPAVLNKMPGRIIPLPTGGSTQDIKVTFSERNLALFDSEKVYTITSPDKTQMVDEVVGGTNVYSSDKWYIQREGRFYRIISGYGKTLYFGTATFGLNDWKLAMIENGPFPNRGVTEDQRKHYYQRLWNITPVAGGGYIIQNAFKVQHHFEFTKNSKVRYMLDDTAGNERANIDKYKISEENFIDSKAPRTPFIFKIEEVK